MPFVAADGMPPNEKLGFGVSLVAAVGSVTSCFANAEGPVKALEKGEGCGDVAARGVNGEGCDDIGVGAVVAVAAFACAPKPKPPKDGKS